MICDLLLHLRLVSLSFPLPTSFSMRSEHLEAAVSSTNSHRPSPTGFAPFPLPLPQKPCHRAG